MHHERERSASMRERFFVHFVYGETHFDVGLAFAAVVWGDTSSDDAMIARAASREPNELSPRLLVGDEAIMTRN